MKENNKIGSEIKVIVDQEDTLDNEQLESVEGGATDCTCDCWIGNSNSSPEKPKKEEEEVSVPKQ